MSNGLIVIINLLVLVFAVVAAVTLIRSHATARIAPVLVIALATLIGLANAFLPPLAALRDHFPLAQPLAVVGMSIGLLAFGLSPAGRDYFRTAAVKPLIALQGWRLMFGALLLAAGMLGALPPAFFWSVALGDMIVGAWAISIWRRREPASHTELKIWSGVSLLDLLHLLPRAVIALPPFYAAHPDLFRPILLPLLGVPMLIALQILLLRRFIADGKSTEGNAPLQSH